MKNIIIILFSLFSLVLFSQEDRYWSNSFNSEATMLAGAVVGGNSDITSLYYNPAGISEIEEKKLILNANLFRLDNEAYNNIIGKNENIQNWGFRVQPRFVSYIHRSKKTRDLSWQLAFFTDNNNYKSFTAYTEKPSSIFNENVGEKIKGSYDYFKEYNDYWGGLGASYQLTDNLSIGIGGFVSVKNLLYSVYQYAIVTPNKELLPDSIKYYQVSSDSYEKIAMYDVRILSKIGIMYKINNFSLGLNITTPSLKLFGNGDVKHKQSYTHYPDSNTTENFIYEENSKYRVDQIKDPFAVAIGGVYFFNKNKSQLYFTTEYFNKIPTYLIIDGKEIVKSEQNNYPANTDFTSYKYGTKSIINYAIGYKQILSEDFDLMLGFRTDFNAYSTSNTGKYKNIKDIQEIHNDMYHFTIGSNFNYNKSQFILGFQYSYGKQDNIKQFANYNTSNINDLTGINNKNMIYSINSLGLFLGFSINF